MSTFKFKSMQNVPDSTTGKAQTDTKVEQGKNEKSSTSIPKFSFGTMPVNTTASAVQPPFFSSTATSNTFSFSSSNASSTSTSPSMSFGKSTSSAVTFTPAMAPFSFGAPLKPTEQVKKPEENKDANDDEDEPPKVEFTPVEEKGHIYTTRCKVFVKKEESGFADRGVGNLYLKPIEGSEKIQLIVRADTNLGNFHALLLWVLVLIDVVL
ncbi:unnamed protein product [Acanthoscelides obtectus]|nr:unnamed protein product [Acanthoscelides obtectus]CAK1620675.1 Nuclear pore complex protein Nup50 [Acanthoscelides obtectus]